MDHQHLNELFRLCPNITSIDLGSHENNYLFPLDELSKFKELKELKLPKCFSFNFLMEFLMKKNSNKLEKISFFNRHRYGIFSYDDYSRNGEFDFYKVLFQNTELKEFGRTPNKFVNEEIKLISEFLNSNSTLKTLKLNRNSFFKC
jgi:hypothetical protein